MQINHEDISRYLRTARKIREDRAAYTSFKQADWYDRYQRRLEEMGK